MSDILFWGLISVFPPTLIGSDCLSACTPVPHVSEEGIGCPGTEVTVLSGHVGALN